MISTIDPKLSDSDKWDEFYTKALTEDDATIFVYEKDREILGFVQGVVYSGKPFEIHDKIGNISVLLVNEKHRSKGIGKLLTDKFSEWCKERGADKVYVNVEHNNTRGIDFYKREGFLDAEVKLEKPLKDY